MIFIYGSPAVRKADVDENGTANRHPFLSPISPKDMMVIPTLHTSQRTALTFSTYVYVAASLSEVELEEDRSFPASQNHYVADDE